MTATRPARHVLRRLRDPFGFADALRDLRLAPDDLPSMTREARLCGRGG